jgi:Flp pilus assembly protein TadD
MIEFEDLCVSSIGILLRTTKTLTILLMNASLHLQAQQQTPPGQTPPQTPTRPNTRADPGTNAPDTQPRSQRTYELPRTYRIEGKILMHGGGGPPPDRISVLAICSGQTSAKTWTDAKGAFGLQLGELPRGGADASFGRAAGQDQQVSAGGGGPHVSSVNDCHLVALLPGFHAENHALGILQPPPFVTKVSLILKPVERVSGYTFSGTTLLAPPAAQKAWKKGNQALSKEHLSEAQSELRKAVELYPKYAVAWYDLGRVQRKAGDREAAKHALQSAIAADPRYINPYPVLAQLALDDRNWEELSRHASSVISLNPFFSANIYVLSAQANLVLNKLDVAEGHAREAIQMDLQTRQFPVAYRLLGRILAKRGDTDGAIEQLKTYLKLVPAGRDAELVHDEIAALQQEQQQIRARVQNPW